MEQCLLICTANNATKNSQLHFNRFRLGKVFGSFTSEHTLFVTLPDEANTMCMK